MTQYHASRGNKQSLKSSHLSEVTFQSQWVNLPAEGSDRQCLGFVILKLPQGEKGSLLLPKLIRGILKVFKIWNGIEGEKLEEKKRDENVLAWLWNQAVVHCSLSVMYNNKTNLVLCHQMYSDWSFVQGSLMPWSIWWHLHSITEMWHYTGWKHCKSMQ